MKFRFVFCFYFSVFVVGCSGLQKKNSPDMSFLLGNKKAEAKRLSKPNKCAKKKIKKKTKVRANNNVALVSLSWLTGEKVNTQSHGGKEIVVPSQNQDYTSPYIERPNLFFYAGVGRLDRDLSFNYVGALFDFPFNLFSEYLPKGLTIVGKAEKSGNTGVIDWKAPWFNIRLKEESMAVAGGMGYKYSSGSFWFDSKILLQTKWLHDKVWKKRHVVYDGLLDIYLGDQYEFNSQAFTTRLGHHRVSFSLFERFKWEMGTNWSLNLDNKIAGLMADFRMEIVSYSFLNTKGKNLFDIALKVGPSFRTSFGGENGGSNDPMAIGGNYQIWGGTEWFNIGVQSRFYAQNHKHKMGYEHSIFGRINF